MPDQSITQLSPYTTPQVSDVLAIVDVSMGITKKIALSVLQSFFGTVTSVSVVTAHGVSGSVATATTTPAITLTLGAITPTSVNGVLAATMAYVDPTSSIQTQLNSKQATLISGTTIKTINSTSLLGSGDISISAAPAGSNTQIQYNSSNSFGASSDFTWTVATNTLTLGADAHIVLNGAATILGDGMNNFQVGLDAADSIYMEPAYMEFDNSAGAYHFTNGASNLGILDFTSIATSNKTFTFPNSSGTFALVSDIKAPGGSDTSVQYNDSSAFGGDTNFTWDKTTKTLFLTRGSGANISVDGSASLVSDANIVFQASSIGITLNSSNPSSPTLDILGQGDVCSLDFNSTTSPRTYTFPDASGTLAVSAGSTGGTGTAGAGKQYIPINVGGVVYKVLHDGTI